MKITPAQLAALSAQANAQRTAAQGPAERARSAQAQTVNNPLKAPPRTPARADAGEAFVPIKAPELAKPQAKASPAAAPAVAASAPAAPAQKTTGLDRAAIIAAAYGRPAETARAQNIPAAWREAPMAGTRPAFVPPGSNLDIKV